MEEIKFPGLSRDYWQSFPIFTYCCSPGRKIHPVIQQNSSSAIWNMVSRPRDQCDTFLSHGVITCDNGCNDGVGCKVHLDEEWKAHSDIQIQNEEDSEDIGAF
ncbi:hypothetical protein quinque_002635 [Culex quinquefasciatus]